MLKTTRHVLKADEVAFEDAFPLDIDPAAAPVSGEPRSATAAPGVRIAESHPDYAVLEVKCACGRTTFVRCEYPGAQT